MQHGDQAPDFTLTDQNDTPVTLSDFRGKWVVLYFYPKDNTSGCTKQACDFTETRSEYDGLDAVILGVSRDSAKVHQGFIAKNDLNLTLLSDPDTAVHKKYGAWGVKKMYGKESEGVIRSTFLIYPEGNIAEAWKNVKVRVKRKTGEVRHVDVVREKLEALKSN